MKDGSRLAFTRPQIAERVQALAAAISNDYRNLADDGRPLILVGILPGCLPFLADLSRALSIPVEVDFMATSRFSVEEERVRITRDTNINVRGRHVLVLEDILDTGLTAGYMERELRRRSPASVGLCCLLDKQARRILPLEPRYRGFAVEDEYFVGYGLDFAERYGNLPELCTVDHARLVEDPDGYVQEFYG